MSFGKKGLVPGQLAPAAASAQALDQHTGHDDIAAKREAFLSSERARKAQEVSAPQASAEHDPLINLRNMSRPEPRPAQPLGGEDQGGGPIGASGMSAAQEAEIRAAARGMARNKPARSGNLELKGNLSGNSATGSKPSYIFGDPQSRNVGLAYVLWLILGQLSLHRFYCGQTDTAIMQISLWIGSLVVLFVFPPLGLIGLAIWLCWLVGDLFMIPGMLRKFQAEHDYSGIFS